MLKAIKNFFKAEKVVYSHRNRTIEIVAVEKNIDINTIINETQVTMKCEGRTEAIIKLRRRFHVPLVTAWIFVDKLDTKQ